MRICVFNSPTSGISATAFALAVAACSRQLTEDVAPTWDCAPPRVEAITSPRDLPPGAALVVVALTCDVDGDAGYHTEELGGLRGIVATEGAGEAWTVTLSHELAELLVDPRCASYINVAGRLVSLEVCDPVEGDSYELGGVQVSNFVTPAWFDDQGEPGEPLDHLGLCTKPGEIREGGYVALADGTTDPPELGARLPARRRHQRARIQRRIARAA